MPNFKKMLLVPFDKIRKQRNLRKGYEKLEKSSNKVMSTKGVTNPKYQRGKGRKRRTGRQTRKTKPAWVYL